MKSSKQIEHSGIITEINNKQIKVHLIEDTYCSTCAAHNSCALSERKDKIIEVFNESGNYSTGEKVTVINEPSLGFKAMFLGYLLPFFLVISALFISFTFTRSELKSGAISILILIPYYFFLFLFRDRLKQTFTFSLKK